MKKLIIVTMALLLMSGCSNNENNTPETTAQSTESTIQSSENVTESTEATEATDAMGQDILITFAALGEAKPVDLLKMSAYLKNNIGTVPQEGADLMLQIYEKAQMQALPAYQDAFFVDAIQSVLLTYTIEELRQNLVEEEAIIKLLAEAEEVGYKIEAIEGTVAPYVDYGYLAQFATYTTEPTSAFFVLMKKESDAPSQKDAALLISWEDVLQRGSDFESYLATYPNSVYAERASMHLKGYTTLAINGSANVPLFEYDTNLMANEAKTAYTAFVEKDLQTEFAQLIKSYMDLLKTHNFVKTSEIEAFMNAYN